MKRIIEISLFLMLLLGSVSLMAQPNNQGDIRLVQDPMVDTLMDQYARQQELLSENDDNDGIPGYRVQIFFDSGNYSGQRAEEARDGFTEEYGGIAVYISWRAPNYRVRVGDFRSRLDAERFLQKIKRDYPNAWVIKSEISYPILKSKHYEKDIGSH